MSIKLPLKIHPGHRFIIMDGNDGFFTSIDGFISSEEKTARRDLILAAVNSHADLIRQRDEAVPLLKKAKLALASTPEPFGCIGDHGCTCNRCQIDDALRDAIAILSPPVAEAEGTYLRSDV